MIDYSDFLRDYRRMRITPCRGSLLVLRGIFDFSASRKGESGITDFYKIKIEVQRDFPSSIPKVIEYGQRIPRDGKHHVNPDGSLCLGSPLRLLKKVSDNPTLVGFAESCLVPYLYAISHKLNLGVEFPFGELAHGSRGIIDDYMNLFKLKTQEQVYRALILLGMKKRLANKRLCPCDCGKRLGICKFHYNLNRYRMLAPRSWIRKHYEEIRIER